MMNHRHSTERAYSRWSGAQSLSRAMLSTLKFIETSPREVAGKMPVAFQGDDPGLYAETVQRSLPMFSRNGQLPPNIDAVVERVLALPPSAQ